jgi:Tfp pilus assembly protein PilF
LVALISAVIYTSTRPRTQGSFPEGQRPVVPLTTLPAGAESNRAASLATESAASNSNWDAIATGLRNDQAAAELATRANASLAAGDPKGAIRALEEALRLTPGDEDLHYNLGIAYGQRGDLTNAEHHYREALRLLPDYPEVHNNLGNLLLRAGRLDEAEELFNEAIAQLPELSSAHNNLGIVHQKRKRLPEAIASFRKAIEYHTNYWQAHFNLAMACLAQGSKEEGLRELETVLRLNPGYAPAQSALEKLLARPATP